MPVGWLPAGHGWVMAGVCLIIILIRTMTQCMQSHSYDGWYFTTQLLPSGLPKAILASK
jgi:hypothetical protein